MCDDLGYGDTGFNGNKVIKTPNLDEMANEGVILTNFHAGGPVCSPTRYTVLTGRHYARSSIYHANKGHIDTAEITIPEILKTKGYVTGHFGKWHVGTLSREFSPKGTKREPAKNYSPPRLNGYDKSFVCESANATWNPTENPRYKNNPYWENGEVASENLDGSTSRIIMDRVIPFIDNAVEDKTPFFSVIWFNAPHAPVIAGPEYRAIYKEYPVSAQHYFGVVTAMDEQVGRLKNELVKLGVYDNTLIMFCSDNGPEGGKKVDEKKALQMSKQDIEVKGKNYWGDTKGLRGRKRAIFEGGVRVPAFVVWGNKLKGRTVDAPLSTLDYLPTIAGIVNYSMPDNRPIDGEDIMSVLEGVKETRNNPIPFWFISARFKYSDNNISPAFSVITPDNYKYLINLDSVTEKAGGKKSNEEGVFDLTTDRGETNNIISKYEANLNRYKKIMDEWWKSAIKSKEGEDFK
jgi:arylsulfatase A-like enzyme